MKTPLFSILVLGTALMMASLQTVRSDDTASGQTDLAGSAAGTGTGAQGEHGGRWKAAFAQLGLTDAQKEQIKQIRANTPAGKERRQQVMAVLTPDQKAKLKQMFEQYRSGKQGDGAGATPSAN
jgi:Spy/CpxP family protein refolding chaperone